VAAGERIRRQGRVADQLAELSGRLEQLVRDTEVEGEVRVLRAGTTAVADRLGDGTVGGSSSA
jgi:hypothetical protein